MSDPFRVMSFPLLTTMEQKSLLLCRYHKPNFQQMVSWNRADEADLTCLQDVMSFKGCPEYNGYMTRSSREQGHTSQEKTKVLYLPLRNLKSSDESNMLTGMLKAVDLSKAAGQKYVVLTLDQQLYRVALQVTWDDPNRFPTSSCDLMVCIYS